MLFIFVILAAILMGMQWYLILILTCIALMANDVEHVLMFIFLPLKTFGEVFVQIFYPF